MQLRRYELRWSSSWYMQPTSGLYSSTTGVTGSIKHSSSTYTYGTTSYYTTYCKYNSRGISSTTTSTSAKLSTSSTTVAVCNYPEDSSSKAWLDDTGENIVGDNKTMYSTYSSRTTYSYTTNCNYGTTSTTATSTKSTLSSNSTTIVTCNYPSNSTSFSWLATSSGSLGDKSTCETHTYSTETLYYYSTVCNTGYDYTTITSTASAIDYGCTPTTVYLGRGTYVSTNRDVGTNSWNGAGGKICSESYTKYYSTTYYTYSYNTGNNYDYDTTSTSSYAGYECWVPCTYPSDSGSTTYTDLDIDIATDSGVVAAGTKTSTTSRATSYSTNYTTSSSTSAWSTICNGILEDVDTSDKTRSSQKVSSKTGSGVVDWYGSSSRSGRGTSSRTQTTTISRIESSSAEELGAAGFDGFIHVSVSTTQTTWTVSVTYYTTYSRPEYTYAYQQMGGTMSYDYDAGNVWDIYVTDSWERYGPGQWTSGTYSYKD